MGRVLVGREWVPMASAAALVRNFPGQARDGDGQFASGSGGGGGGDDFGDDPYVGEMDEGDYGYGRDPNGVSYTEFDVDMETGEPKFSPAYRERYGPLTSDSPIGTSGLSLASGEKVPGVHVADDSQGTMKRSVVQEFTPKQAAAAGEGIYGVYAGERGSFSGAGISVRPAGPNPTRDGVEVTWSNGTTTRFEGEAGDDGAFELQEGLDILSGPTNRARMPRTKRQPR